MNPLNLWVSFCQVYYFSVFHCPNRVGFVLFRYLQFLQSFLLISGISRRYWVISCFYHYFIKIIYNEVFSSISGSNVECISSQLNLGVLLTFNARICRQSVHQRLEFSSPTSSYSPVIISHVYIFTLHAMVTTPIGSQYSLKDK